jgi:tRNA(Ile)-lysidine synthase
MNIYDSKKVITAHHLDDKLETFFFNLVRWSKLTWLINMKENYWGILRPLLNIEKINILDYLEKNNLEYQIDKSNFDTKITRNKLRNDILPLFSSINNNYKSNVNNLIWYLDDLKTFVDIEINNFLNKQNEIIINTWNYKINKNEINWCFYLNNFLELPLFLQKEIIRYIFYISNWNSTIWLTESNINEVLKFINWKNNNTKKDIKNMKLTKKTNIIIY